MTRNDKNQTGPLAAFSGSRFFNPDNNEHIPNATSRHYGSDLSGKISYRYNSLGFRGEEFNPEAKYHIFVCGPSESFGVGLSEEDTWWGQFRIRYAEHKEVDEKDINVMNFSQGGCSFEYVTRELVKQSLLFKPDVILGSLCPKSRVEYYPEDPSLRARTPTVYFNEWFRGAIINRNVKVRGVSNEAMEELLDAAQCYYTHYSNESALMYQIRNLSLLHYYCQSQDIPYLFWSLKRFSLKEDLSKTLTEPVESILDSIDLSRVLTYQFKKRDGTAADNLHPGPGVNKEISGLLYDMYTDLYV